MSKFRTWLERAEEVRRVVISDLDECLVHSIEFGWLKDSPKNKHYAKMAVPGKDPYPDVFEIKYKEEERFVFPRPGSMKFIKSISQFAELYILTHKDKEYSEKVVKGAKWSPYIKGIFSTGEMEPGQLAKKLDLKNAKWVLVDNLATHSVEVTNKLRILGLCWPNLKPKEEAKKIAAKADDVTIDVEDWVPTVDYDDYSLWSVLPKVKYKLGLGDLK